MSVSVSIIIANYNNSKYITDCLKSIALQSFNDWEAIVVDDASTDNSVNIIKQFKNKDHRFSLIKTSKNSGLSAARNKGLKAARGKYVMFLDSDDCIVPGALEKLYNIANKYSADAVKAQRYKVSDSFCIDATPNDIKLSETKQVIYNPAQSITSWFKDPMFVWLYLYKRSIIKHNQFIVGMRPCEDVNFTIKTLPYIKKLVIVDAVSVFYRLSNNSIMQNYKVTNSTIRSKVINCEDIIIFFENCGTCSDIYKKISKNLVYDLLLIDIFYIPLMQREDLLDYTHNIVKSLSSMYDVKSFYNLRTRLAILAYSNKMYRISRLLLDKKYFRKYTRTINKGEQK